MNYFFSIKYLLIYIMAFLWILINFKDTGKIGQRFEKTHKILGISV